MVRELSLSKLKLLDLDGGADCLELCLESFCIFLGNAFLELCRNFFDELLGLCKAETGDAADFLDDLDLLCAEAGHDNVELGLLFNDLCCDCGACCCCDCGNAEGFANTVYEFLELENGESLDLFDHSGDFFTHFNFPPKILH